MNIYLDKSAWLHKTTKSAQPLLQKQYHPLPLQPWDEDEIMHLGLPAFQLPQLVVKVLDVVQGDGEALHQVGQHIHLSHLEVLFVPFGTKGHLGADQHLIQLPPVVHQGVFQIGYFHFNILLLLQGMFWGIQPLFDPLWRPSPDS